jgi:putative spermidine/putrescine transport system permease protein
MAASRTDPPALGRDAPVGWAVLDGIEWLRRKALPEHRESAGRVVMLMPAMVLLSLLIWGVAALIEKSFHTFDPIFLVQGPWSLDQYATLIHDPQFKTVLIRTVSMSLVCSIMTLALALPLSFHMAALRRAVVRRVIVVLLFVPVLTGDITRTFAWLVTFAPTGPFEAIARAVGLPNINLIGTLALIAIGIVQVQLPIAVVLLLPSIVGTNPELEAAAATLGARPSRVFVTVTLPLLRAPLAVAAGLLFVLAMSSFADPAILGSGLNNFLANYLQNRYLNLGNPAQGAAIAVVMLVLMCLGFTVFALLGGKRRIET